MSVKLVEEWRKAPGSLNVSPITDPYIQENMARLLQNQKDKNLSQELFQEAGQFATGLSGSGANNPVPASGSGYGVFGPVSMALVRRTFPAFLANKVVGVQPMNSPISLAYAIRYMYRLTDGTVAHEAGWDKIPEYSGFTGSTSGSSATADSGTGVSSNVAENWLIKPTGEYPQLTFRIDRQAIEAKTRKLATSFSLEAAMDVKAMHDIEIERELINMIQYELIAEQDRELLAYMKTAAVRTTNAFTNVEYGGEAALTFDVAKSDGRWSQEKFSTIINIIVDRANEIARKTRRGAGNFVIVSPRVATALQAAQSSFTRNTAMIDATTIFPEVGTINGTIKVYRDNYAVSDYALVGYKGPGISDSGIIYSPYVTGLVNRAIAQEDFSPRLGVMSRYAITDSLLGSGRYYRLINFTNVDALLNGTLASVTYTSAV